MGLWNGNHFEVDFTDLLGKSGQLNGWLVGDVDFPGALVSTALDPNKTYPSLSTAQHEGVAALLSIRAGQRLVNSSR